MYLHHLLKTYKNHLLHRPLHASPSAHPFPNKTTPGVPTAAAGQNDQQELFGSILPVVSWISQQKNSLAFWNRNRERQI